MHHREAVYVLCAVVVHSGPSAHSGHYITYGTDYAGLVAAALTGINERWVLFNDSRVAESSGDSLRNITRRFPRVRSDSSTS